MTPLTVILILFAAAASVAIVQLARQLNAQRERHAREVGKLAKDSSQEAERSGEHMRRILAILQSMNEGVLVVDDDERVLLANSVFSGVIGVPRDAIEGKLYWEVIRDSTFNGFIRRALTERVLMNAEHELLLSDRVFQTQVSPVFGKDEFLGAVAVLHDVTRLKELERQRTEFVANVSHELKTPLTSIMGFVETLKEGAGDDPKDRAQFLGIIDEQSKKLFRLIEDLLLLSKVESGRAPLLKEKINVLLVTEKLLKPLRPAITAKRMTVETAVPGGYLLPADPHLFEQALSNLIDNAVKYGEPGGRITIRAFDLDGACHIEVADSGPGIPPDDLQRIFERFYRVEKGRSRDQGGTGLGLSIVKHIAERHGGAVSVKSRPLEGSVFTLSFPKTS